MCVGKLLEPQNGGTVTSDGVYTAPPQAVTYYVAAVNIANPARLHARGCDGRIIVAILESN